ncbi:alpha/beta hydrolase family protein [Streptomyces hesseae]|uniref:Prolyl oligopeptidase family serine peptidase n=1 Tax=Streptomyces hesseae TaxID=3075519 RepID=A0ABU2SGJ9_9ACTN|nr:prolyl oligopeptidase family serine peptidase [Streptomyces sp. DSM 40473]MDT0448075.1 prolyl oligopeptidase family serine peptidase [Streptomyces sp. DSM 40473]
MLLLSSRTLIRLPAFALVWAVLGVLLLPVAEARADGDGLVREEVSFAGGDGLTLHGTVLASATARGKRPGIVLVGGSGPGPREEYRQEAEAFARAGVTTLVYDKRTVRYSTTHRDFGLLADDALAGVRLLRGRGGVDPHHVGLWGFSEGGWVAPLAATRSSDVAFVITIGGPGHSPLRTQAWNLNTHLRHRGVTGSFPDTVAGPAARLIASTGAFPAGDYDPLPVLERLGHTPVLALWGRHDTQVPPQESAQIFRRALARAGNEHAVIGFVAGAAHNGHRTSDGFDRLGGPLYHGKPLGALAPGYADTMTSWVNEVAADRPPASHAAPAPPQAVTSTPVPDGRYAWLAPALLLLGFAAHPAVAALRRIARRPRTRARTPRSTILLRWLTALGIIEVTGALLCPLAVFAAGDAAATPVVAGSPAFWLLLKVLAIGLLALAATTAVTAWRERHALGRTLRLRTLTALTTAAGFALWAPWWGLLRP